MEGARGQCQLTCLFHHGGQDFWMAVALIDSRIGREAIEITVTFDIPHPEAFAARQHDADRLIVIGAKADFRGEEISDRSNHLRHSRCGEPARTSSPTEPTMTRASKASTQMGRLPEFEN